MLKQYTLVEWQLAMQWVIQADMNGDASHAHLNGLLVIEIDISSTA
jgi:hypothetical protein